ncbi:MAG: hypothetical protein KC488_01405, partial [Candidatus Cloacimonetes bacterium]|nr:hypothetical protein [Candidatus Cloacimonadota bacterium]
MLSRGPLVLLLWILMQGQCRAQSAIVFQDSLEFDRSEELEWSDWKVASIRVTGLEHVREEAVIRELEMHPGDLYSDAELVQDANAIK